MAKVDVRRCAMEVMQHHLIGERRTRRRRRRGGESRRRLFFDRLVFPIRFPVMFDKPIDRY